MAIEVVETIALLDAALRAAGDPERAASEKDYLKSALSFYGAGMPAIRRIAQQFGRPGALEPSELHALSDALWATGVHEHRALAVVLLERHERSLGNGDLGWLLALVRNSETWAYVDSLAVHTIGPVLRRTPDAAKWLRDWARDADFWVRRTALLAPLEDLRRGRGDFALWSELAVPMLSEKEFFIRKAIGWVLRESAPMRPAEVRAFVEEHGAVMAGLTRREAEKGLARTS
ncbi:MAG: DNA alkylation repair protein [Myxococcales bacterium]|nr:DNA alkylation repair protein [Myxococcales bacterium]